MGKFLILLFTFSLLSGSVLATEEEEEVRFWTSDMSLSIYVNDVIDSRITGQQVLGIVSQDLLDLTDSVLIPKFSRIVGFCVGNCISELGILTITWEKIITHFGEIVVKGNAKSSGDVLKYLIPVKSSLQPFFIVGTGVPLKVNIINNVPIPGLNLSE